jgi:hypothetical protein
MSEADRALSHLRRELDKHHARPAAPGTGRDGKRTESGLQAHLRVVHGYALTSLAARTVLELVFLHQRATAHQPYPKEETR